MIEVARLLLAAVFAVAAVAKLADLRGAAQAAQDFGAPRRLAGPVALLVVLAELGIAAALVPTASARVAAAAAAGVVAVFTAAIAVSLLRGRAPDCHCFGQLHSAQAGPATLARNAALAGVAVLVASQPAADPSLVELAAAGVAIVLVAQALLSVTLLRRYGRALRRIEELETGAKPLELAVGTHAPDFTLPSSEGGEVSLAGLLSRAQPLLLVFADPDCGPCHALMPRVADWQRSLSDRLTVAVITRGDREESLALTGELGLRNVLAQEDREVNELYGIWATPSAALVGADGRIEQGAMAGAEAIERVVQALTPADERVTEQPQHARRELATAAAAVGGLALTAGVAQASPGSRDQQPANPELQAIDAALKAAGPRILAASLRSLKAVRAQATLSGGTALRAKRTAARKALAAERREVLALRARVATLPETSVEARNVKRMVDNCLSLLARSALKRQQAIGAAPQVGLRLVKEGQQLFLASVAAGGAAGKVLGE